LFNAGPTPAFFISEPRLSKSSSRDLLGYLVTDENSFYQHPYRAYIRRHWRPFTGGMIALLVTNGLDALAPLFIGMAIDQIISEKPFADVSRTVLIIFAVTAALAVCRFLWRYLWGHFHHAVAEDLRNRLFAKFTDLGPAFFSKRTT